MKHWKLRTALYTTLLMLAMTALLTGCKGGGLQRVDVDGNGLIDERDVDENGDAVYEETPKSKAAWDTAELLTVIAGSFFPPAAIGTILVRSARSGWRKTVTAIEEAKTGEDAGTFTVDKDNLRKNLAELGLLKAVEKKREGTGNSNVLPA